ncbi:phosphotransferase family protein [Streptodolium elevatio]|uniref:Phosphotransferase family protein n=1 Tax=Streptodolium elevatio TaxID=3157996 RepID=A0ABV3DS12_9ACTN
MLFTTFAKEDDMPPTPNTPDTATAREPEELREQLRAWLARETGDPDLAVSPPQRTTLGFSRENWFFDAVWKTNGHGDGRTRLVARRDPVGSVLDSDRAVEAAVLAAVHRTDVPVPALHWVDLDGAEADRPTLVMDRAPGRCEPFVLAGPLPEAERAALAGKFCEQLAAIHRLDPAALGLGGVLADPGPGAAHVAVAHWDAELRKIQQAPEPELEYILAWLTATAPASGATTLVHGDFKPGNVLIEDGRVTAVLDWETAHLGDPLEDVGWVTNPLRAREHLIPGVWERDDLIAAWERHTGRTADRLAVRWWNVLANLKLTVIVMAGQHALAHGRYDRIIQTPTALHRVMLGLISTYGHERGEHA